MIRLLALATLVAAPLLAQERIFVAPSPRNVVASVEQLGGFDKAHIMYVTNNSSVAVVVYAFELRDCENVRQDCVQQRLDVTVPPGARRQIGRVQPHDRDARFTYKWNYGVRTNSTEAAIAALRAHGYVLDDVTGMPRAVGEGTDDPRVVASMNRPDGVPAAERAVEAPAASSPSADVPASAVSSRPLIASTEVDGFAQAASAVAPTRRFFVHNKSAFPIIVYSFNLATCVNVKQACDRTPVDVRIPAGGRLQVGQVDALVKGRKYTYDWTYDWKPDASDARVAAAMRARGMRDGLVDAPSGPVVETAGDVAGAPASRERLTADEHQGKATLLDANNRAVAVSATYRYRVMNGSILAATKAKPGTPILPTGACIDPDAFKRLQEDTTITGSPAVAPRLLATSIALPTLPAELSGSTPADAHVVVRWAIDTEGNTVPESVNVLESPHGLLSVKMCGAILAAHVVPGKDASGRPVRVWVEAPISVAH